MSGNASMIGSTAASVMGEVGDALPFPLGPFVSMGIKVVEFLTGNDEDPNVKLLQDFHADLDAVKDEVINAVKNYNVAGELSDLATEMSGWLGNVREQQGTINLAVDSGDRMIAIQKAIDSIQPLDDDYLENIRGKIDGLRPKEQELWSPTDAAYQELAISLARMYVSLVSTVALIYKYRVELFAQLITEMRRNQDTSSHGTLSEAYHNGSVAHLQYLSFVEAWARGGVPDAGQQSTTSGDKVAEFEQWLDDIKQRRLNQVSAVHEMGKDVPDSDEWGQGHYDELALDYFEDPIYHIVFKMSHEWVEGRGNASTYGFVCHAADVQAARDRYCSQIAAVIDGEKASLMLALTTLADRLSRLPELPGSPAGIKLREWCQVPQARATASPGSAPTSPAEQPWNAWRLSGKYIRYRVRFSNERGLSDETVGDWVLSPQQPASYCPVLEIPVDLTARATSRIVTREVSTNGGAAIEESFTFTLDDNCTTTLVDMCPLNGDDVCPTPPGPPVLFAWMYDVSQTPRTNWPPFPFFVRYRFAFVNAKGESVERSAWSHACYGALYQDKFDSEGYYRGDEPYYGAILLLPSDVSALDYKVYRQFKGGEEELLGDGQVSKAGPLTSYWHDVQRETRATENQQAIITPRINGEGAMNRLS